MSEIQKPNFKSNDFTGQWKELLRYLHSVVDDINWNVLTLENRQTFLKKNLSLLLSKKEENLKKEMENGIFTVKLAKSGAMAQVIVKGEPVEEAATNTGTVILYLTEEFSPMIYDLSVPIAKSEGMTVFLEKNKITIDYDFGEKSNPLGAYFQYFT